MYSRFKVRQIEAGHLDENKPIKTETESNGLVASHDGKQRSENINTIDSPALYTLLQTQSLTANYHNYKSRRKHLA